MNKYGFVRITTVAPKVFIGEPEKNIDEHIRIADLTRDSDIVMFPELSASSYSAADMFHQEALLQDTWNNILSFCEAFPNDRRLFVLGAPLALDNALFNCTVVINEGAPVGIYPKPFIPNYKQFYEGRHFALGHLARSKVCNPLYGHVYPGERWFNIPFGTDLLFKYQIDRRKVTIGIDPCEAMFMPIPPSSIHAILGAIIHLNPSASNDEICKDLYRECLVMGQSGRCISAYAYASAGPTESTAEMVFGGHRMIAEAGKILVNESSIMPVVNRESAWTTADVDVDKLWRERRVTTSYNTSLNYVREFEPRWITINLRQDEAKTWGLKRKVEGSPFVPKDAKEFVNRCLFVTNMQTAGLAQRLCELTYKPKIVLGSSGGADSGHATVILRRTCDLLAKEADWADRVTCWSLRGFGSTPGTIADSLALPRALGFKVREHDIRPACFQKWRDMEYNPFGIDITKMSWQEFETKLPSSGDDLTFENVQALYRKDFLFDNGFVIGTSDMAEAFLGWCTYCADQQAAYHVNIGVPKTVIRWLLAFMAESVYGATHPHNAVDHNIRVIHDTLTTISGRKFSPELLPCVDGVITQITEDKIGPYELQEFLMLNMLNNGYDPEKMLFIGDYAEGWSVPYSREERKKWMGVGLTRFFSQQYKRENIPNGVKVGSLALSPRGDLRMAPGTFPNAWLRSLNTEK